MELPADLSALSDQAIERSRLSVAARFRRLQSKAWMVAQCAIAAGVAWVIATEVFGHQTPFFAPVAAFLCLGTSYGQRLRRVGEVTVGVAVGIMIADGFTHLFGRGSWQIVVVVAVAMSAAILLDAGQLFVSQAAVQAIVVTTLLPLNQSASRIADAFIGGGVALLAATIVPGAPLRRPREEAAKVTFELARLLRAARQSAEDISTEQAEVTLSRARETEGLLDDLRAAAQEGIEVVRSSPFRRHHRVHVRSMAELVAPLDRALRNTRVLARRVLVSARLDETMPPDYLDLLKGLADATDEMARDLAANQPPYSAQPALVALGETTADASTPLTLSAAVVLGQIRSLVVDLLELSGMTYSDAIGAVPNR
jgi:uncharacterized membrane protein YgaE (UPF0421/DUF939 family)